jgi:hypothetical protein
MGNNPSPERARKVEAAHAAMVKDATVMVRLLGVHDTAAVLLGALRVVLIDMLGRKGALELLRAVVGRLEEHDGPPPKWERN